MLLPTGESRALGTLAAGKGDALLVFVRHFGCVGCSAEVDALRTKLPLLRDLGVSVVLLGVGSPAQLASFVAREALDPRALTAVTDPSLAVHRAFGMKRSLWGAWGPRALWAAAVLIAKGYRQSAIEGDSGAHGGAVLLRADGGVERSFASDTLGVGAPWGQFLDAVLRRGAERRSRWP